MNSKLKENKNKKIIHLNEENVHFIQKICWIKRFETTSNIIRTRTLTLNEKIIQSYFWNREFLFDIKIQALEGF